MDLAIPFAILIFMLCFIICNSDENPSELDELFVNQQRDSRNNAENVEEKNKSQVKERKELIMKTLRLKKFSEEDKLKNHNGDSSTSPNITVPDGDEDSVYDDIEKPEMYTEEEDHCPICLGEFEVGQDICRSPNEKCSHIFHVHCVVPWLLKNNDCPCCREDYLHKSKCSTIEESTDDGKCSQTITSDTDGIVVDLSRIPEYMLPELNSSNSEERINTQHTVLNNSQIDIEAGR